MKTSTLIVTLIMVLIVFPLAGAILTPPDVISQMALAIPMMVIYGILTFIVSRFKSFGQTPESIKRLIVVLVCLLSITMVYTITSFLSTIHLHRDSSYVPLSESGNLRFGNLWVKYSSGGGIDNVVCSVDSPTTCTSGGPHDRWMLAFPDGSSVEFVIINQQTVWIDKQHRVTFLGPVLTKEDVSLMRSHGHDEKLKISSPDELLTLVKKLRAEQIPSTAPAKAVSY